LVDPPLRLQPCGTPLNLHGDAVTQTLPKFYRNMLRGLTLCAAAALLIGTSRPAEAQEFREGSYISDLEIDNTLKAYARPLVIAGGLPPDAVQVGMIVSSTPNAFATRGGLIFFHTGTLMDAENSNQIIGVLAHEIGHVALGHAATFGDAYSKAGTIAMLSTLLGVVAGVASGNPDVGMAVALGGQGTAMRQLLSYSRGQESASDQFALGVLEQTHQSSKGLYDFFNMLSGQELLITDRQDPYVRSHPLTRDRMDVIQNFMRTSPYTNIVPNPEFERLHRRMVAKLFAFMKPQMSTLQRYPDTDASPEGRYARSIAYFRRGQVDKGVPLIDGLITEFPEDAYFWELKGEMMFKNGRLPESIEAYRKAADLLPGAPPLLVSMAHVMVETGDPSYAEEAQAALRVSLRQEPNNPFAWDLAARSYAQNDKPGLSAYAASERALLTGAFGDVVRYTQQAEKLLEKDTPTWYRLQDIKVAAQNYMQDMRRQRR